MSNTKKGSADSEAQQLREEATTLRTAEAERELTQMRFADGSALDDRSRSRLAKTLGQLPPHHRKAVLAAVKGMEFVPAPPMTADRKKELLGSTATGQAALKGKG